MVSWKHTYKISAKPRLDVQEQVYYFGVTIMEVSYKKLWKLLIDKDMVLNFESGDKAGQDVRYNLTMCLNNGWIEVVD